MALCFLLLWPACLHAQFNYIITNGTVTITGYTGPGGAVVIPGTLQGLPVTRIGASAFNGCSGLTNVTIPDSVISIGSMAFYGCPSLTSVSIPVNVTCIGDYAFSCCSGLTSVTLPNGLSTIGQCAFSSCPGLTYIIVPNSVTQIGDSAFAGNCHLASITVEALNPMYRSVEGVLFDKRGTNLLVCPAGKVGGFSIPSATISISHGAFLACSGLTNITIPPSVNVIGDCAFAGCTGLANMTIPEGVSILGSDSFTQCSGLTTITIPNSVTNLGPAAFYGCSSLASVTLGSGVTRLDSYWDWALVDEELFIWDTILYGAFGGCTNLAAIIIPGSVNWIGDGTFLGCTRLTSIYFKGDAPSGGSDIFGANLATVYYLPGTTGWGSTLSGRPTALWRLPYPLILTPAPNFGKQTNTFGFRTSWATNASVVVEASSDLASPSWSPLSTNTLLNGWTDFRDPSPATTPARFYRVREL